MDNLCFDKRFVVSLTIVLCAIVIFNNHDHWPWPRRLLALALNTLSSNPSLVLAPLQ